MLKYKLTFFIVLFLAGNPVFADSAAAWKTYQDGRNPMMEAGLIVVGMMTFFGVLALLNTMVEAKKKRVKKSSRRK